MTREDARERVESIRKARDDDDRAHGLEDELYEDFILHVSVHAHDELAKTARIVLASKRIYFDRHCA